jgi:holo-[acyl-carrier protein] synthase
LLETGVDIIEIERIEAALSRHGRRFLERVYTELEQVQCRGRAESLAARFAAKEAAFKALGSRFGWRDVEVRCQPSGKPLLRFHGRALERAKRLNLREWSVSLSHSRGSAVAIVVTWGG